MGNLNGDTGTIPSATSTRRCKRFQYKTKWWFLLLIISLLFLPHTARCQQSASLNIPLYTNDTNLSQRKNICDRAQKYHIEVMDDLELRYALEGMQLNVAAINGIYFWYENGALNEDYPGLTAVLLDEIARRGRFTWRNSFAVYDGHGEGRTWTELLLFTTNYFDLSADWWIETVPRLKLGVAFPEGWYDSSYILVTAAEGNKEDGRKVNMWAWTKPFELDVWVMMLFTVVWSSVVYMFLEYLALPRQYIGSKATESFGNDLYFSFLLFTQHFQFTPKTTASRLLAASMAFWALLVGSAYTANLAGFFVEESNHRQEVQSIEDAIRLGRPICVFESSASTVYVQQRYPTVIYVKLEEEKDIYTSLNAGICAAAVTTVASFQDYSKRKETNADCRLQWIGNIIKPSLAGFATRADSGRKCTSLIHDVVNLHILEMQADGFLERAWDEHYDRNSDHFCDGIYQGNEDSQSLSLYAMGGTFVVHFVVSLTAVILAVSKKLWKVYKNRNLTANASLDDVGSLSNGTLAVRGSKNHPATTLLQDFWGETPSVKLRADSIYQGTHPEESNGGLNHTQLLDLMQEQLQHQQEQLERRVQDQLAAAIEEKLQRQLAPLELRMQQQHDQLQGQLTSLVNSLRENLIGAEGRSSARPIVPSASVSNDEKPHKVNENQNMPEHGLAQQQPGLLVRRSADQMPQLLRPHEKEELQGATAEYLKSRLYFT